MRSKIAIVGLNHKTAKIDIREKLAFSDEEVRSALLSLKKNKDILELIIFSTCNRVEFLIVYEENSNFTKIITNFIQETRSISEEEFENSLYIHKGEDAIRHIMQVASSLDSLIVGEPQILGQIKKAYKNAAELRSTKIILNKLLHKTFQIAKEVRTQTKIGNNAVSISYAAVKLAMKIFGDLREKNVLLIGAGEMAELALEHLIYHNCKQVFISNRTFEKSMELAKKFKGEAILFEEKLNKLKEADIIISSTASKDFILKHEEVKKIMPKRKNKVLFFIDIAVPRDIDPLINTIDNCYLYDLDNLENVIHKNLEEREQEVVKAKRIIDTGVIAFQNAFANLKIAPTITDLKEKLEDIIKSELKKGVKRKNTYKDKDEEIELITNAITNKIIFDPVSFLKKETTHHKDRSRYINFFRLLFNLDKEE